MVKMMNHTNQAKCYYHFISYNLQPMSNVYAVAYFEVGNYNFIEIVWQMIAPSDMDVMPATRITGKYAAYKINLVLNFSLIYSR
jgi:hypothetical protein